MFCADSRGLYRDLCINADTRCTSDLKKYGTRNLRNRTPSFNLSHAILKSREAMWPPLPTMFCRTLCTCLGTALALVLRVRQATVRCFPWRSGHESISANRNGPLLNPEESKLTGIGRNKSPSRRNAAEMVRSDNLTRTSSRARPIGSWIVIR